MIFVAVGQQKFKFNRLINKIDELIESGVISEDVFVQYGYSDAPRVAKGQQFLATQEMSEKIKQADLIIMHAGSGMIVESQKQAKRIIVVPRLQAYDEHVDNHQFEIADYFEKSGALIVDRDPELKDLPELIDKAMNMEVKPFKFSNERLVNRLRKIIMEV